ncbi:HK97 gp10 family phage protein [Hymenobacter sp. HSC-4F20]|uniref:HK97-gp10 family putative phage morphogenesis protein n=1 Tax=Hymenobacter sp. HSC-4F20 TaxID=2864135 RepID=UPI001C72FD58|nr:HK97-gp10 family putative phage morphogenesis protein [Hymenobacter sp. HSC-4F20]MBX0290113.1 HK97 gp10 family phage protein [Hymenobacter sp. HSC-4F20]
MVSSSIGGLDALLKQLSSFGKQVESVAAEEAQATAEAIRDTAQELAPVATGKLRDSIQVEAQGKTFLVGSTLSYAPDKELGTRQTQAKPFLYPAYLLHRDKFLDNLKQAINRL